MEWHRAHPDVVSTYFFLAELHFDIGIIVLTTNVLNILFVIHIHIAALYEWMKVQISDGSGVL